MKMSDILTEEEISDCFLSYATKGMDELVCKLARMTDTINERAKQPIDPRHLAYALLNVWKQQLNA